MAEEPITTEDAFPPEDGRYMVSFDLHLLQSGFKLDKYDRNAAGETVCHCIPHDFPRCTVIASLKQYYQAIGAMAENVRKDVEQQQSSLEQAHSAQATTIVLPPPLTAPPPLPTPAADTATAKEGTKLEGLPDSINANKPPKSYKDAMSREDSREWQDAYFKEYKGMMDRGAVRAVKPPPGAKILGTTTRTEYKTSNGIFDKRKVRMCVRGD